MELMRRGAVRDHTSLTRGPCEGCEARADAGAPVADPCVRALDLAVCGIRGVRLVRPCQPLRAGPYVHVFVFFYNSTAKCHERRYQLGNS